MLMLNYKGSAGADSRQTSKHPVIRHGAQTTAYTHIQCISQISSYSSHTLLSDTYSCEKIKIKKQLNMKKKGGKINYYNQQLNNPKKLWGVSRIIKKKVHHSKYAPYKRWPSGTCIQPQMQQPCNNRCSISQSCCQQPADQTCWVWIDGCNWPWLWLTVWVWLLWQIQVQHHLISACQCSYLHAGMHPRASDSRALWEMSSLIILPSTGHEQSLYSRLDALMISQAEACISTTTPSVISTCLYYSVAVLMLYPPTSRKTHHAMPEK